MAFGTHPRLSLEAGDAVIFSARVIPGHELGVGRLHNTLLRRGRPCLHPARCAGARLGSSRRGRIAGDVHDGPPASRRAGPWRAAAHAGPCRHRSRHAASPRLSRLENGAIVRLAPAPAGIVETVPSGRLALEGNRLVPLDGNLVRDRTKAIYKGVAVATVAVNNCGVLVKEPLLSTIGLVEDWGRSRGYSGGGRHRESCRRHPARAAYGRRCSSRGRTRSSSPRIPRHLRQEAHDFHSCGALLTRKREIAVPGIE